MRENILLGSFLSEKSMREKKSSLTDAQNFNKLKNEAVIDSGGSISCRAFSRNKQD